MHPEIGQDLTRAQGYVPFHHGLAFMVITMIIMMMMRHSTSYFKPKTMDRTGVIPNMRKSIKEKKSNLKGASKAWF